VKASDPVLPRMIERADSPLVSALHPSPNIGERRGGMSPSILLLHYTGVATCARAIDWLAQPVSKVSCHYVIDEHGVVTQMVAETMRAWHAGVSRWAGESDINSASIGIEIQNPGHEHGYPDYPEVQMQAVVALSRDIIARNRIRPERVLAHSDIAPERKIDPGEKFDWKRLAEAGIGHWVSPAEIDDDKPLVCDSCGERVHDLQTRLARYGYGIEATGQHDMRSVKVVAAFQRHFRQSRVDGCIDTSTEATLDRLIGALPPAVA